MSEKMIRSGISSGESFILTKMSKIWRIAALKFVLPPHGAPCILRTFATTPSSASSTNQLGRLSKVSTRWANAGAASSETRMPSAMATSIGCPHIESETSTSGTSLPRSMRRTGARACWWNFIRSLRESSPNAAAAGAPAPCSAVSSITLASCSLIDSRSAAYCALSTSVSAAESSLRPAIAVRAISCGMSCAPLSLLAAPLATAARCFLRACTRSSSSGRRLPVSSCAGGTLPRTFSLRKALRLRFMQSEGTWVKSSSAKRCAPISTSGVNSARLSLVTRLR
mmetsp:Transcript_45986/g.107401  ORF Transcript_45986/g.107401 Transcript_45986/m.107401 type:complete len:283 (-) Transcript_45986:783-1631(-)